MTAWESRLNKNVYTNQGDLPGVSRPRQRFGKKQAKPSLENMHSSYSQCAVTKMFVWLPRRTLLRPEQLSAQSQNPEYQRSALQYPGSQKMVEAGRKAEHTEGERTGCTGRWLQAASKYNVHQARQGMVWQPDEWQWLEWCEPWNY